MAKEIKAENKKTKIKKGFINGTGRRKTAVARVFLYNEKGDFTVNEQDIGEYFPSEKDQLEWTKPFHLVGISHPKSKFSASIKVEGSGKKAQLGAVVHGLSRALAEISEENRKILRRQGLLTRDPRMKERKKYYLRKARKRPQYSKR
jgi:small subunit ribosomal protein S9